MGWSAEHQTAKDQLIGIDRNYTKNTDKIDNIYYI
jgi:hypothetical protein